MEEDPKRREAEARDDGGSGKGGSGKGEKGKIALENEEKTGGGETKSSGCGWARGIQTTLVFLGFLLLGLSRAMQGPTLEDLKVQAGIDLDDFAFVFAFGALSFPLGNFAAGYLVDRCRDPMALMTGVCAVVFVFHTGIAFTTSLATLIACSTVMEFGMGMLDTGCNVLCLRLWRGHREGPYFTALHSFFNIGNIIGPILAGLILQDHHDVPVGTSPPPTVVDSTTVSTPPDDDGGLLLRVLPTRLSRLQWLHLLVGAALLLLTASFFACSVSNSAIRKSRKRRGKAKKDIYAVVKPDDNNAADLESSDSSCSSESASDRRLAGRYSRGRLLFLFGIMTAFFFCFNGTNFGFFNFLTALAMRHPRLGLPKSAGARATTVYFASSAVARLVSAVFIARLPSPSLLVVLDLLILATGSGWLYYTVSPARVAAFPDPEPSLIFGCALVGVGISTLFSSGVLWLIGYVGQLSGQVTSLFLVATSAGAQCFKIPVAFWIEDSPDVVLHVISFGASVCSVLFAASFLLAYYGRGSDGKKHPGEDGENQKEEPLLQPSSAPEKKEDVIKT